MAPTVQSVRVYYGPNAYAEMGSLTRNVLPWASITKVAVVFSEDVTVAGANLGVTNIGGSVGSSFTYDAATRTALWNLDQPLAEDRVTVRLFNTGIVDRAGNALGKDWARTFGLLAGDYDGNGVVNSTDLAKIKKKFGKVDCFADIDGNGFVNQADYDLALANKGNRLK